MAMTMHVDIVSAESEIFSGLVEMVFAPATMGEVGVLPGHAPLVTTLKPGEVRVRHSGGEEEADVSALEADVKADPKSPAARIALGRALAAAGRRAPARTIDSRSHRVSRIWVREAAS